MALKQFSVKWDGRELLVYAKDEGHAKVQVGAPADAAVKPSFVTEKDLARLLARGMKRQTMKRYVVRKNCEYSIVIEAEDEDEAMDKAQKLHDVEWSEAWSPTEAEEEE